MKCRSGFTLVELLTTIAIIGILVAMILPAVQQSRESARRADCQNRLKQIGLALQHYHSTHQAFPPGCVGVFGDPANVQAWGWGVLTFPFLEQSSLYDGLDPRMNDLQTAIGSSAVRQLMQTRLESFRCPSDNADELAHEIRELTGFVLMAPPSPLISFHANHGGGNPSIIGVKPAAANYVGSFGDYWNPISSIWTRDELAGNGVLGSHTRVRFADVTDGTSNTFAVGERSWRSFAGVWLGVDGWDRCDSEGLPMVLGSAHYRLNIDPDPFWQTCDGRGSVGFGSRHVGGAQFVMCDGAVRFISDTIDFRVGQGSLAPGVYQRLARRNDGLPTSGF
jgi:prepilin-type N-terminal cleavage/methylation domain-containing protein